MIEIAAEALTPAEQSEVSARAFDYFERRVGSDVHRSWTNNPAPGEILCFTGAANLIRHLEWEGYEYGFRRLESFRQLLCLATVAFAKLLQRPLCVVPLEASRRLAILAEDMVGRPYPILLEGYLVPLLANPREEQFDPIYAALLTRIPADWGPGTFPLLYDSMWMPNYFGVELPSSIRQKWFTANERSRCPDGTGVGVARRLRLRAPLAIIDMQWERLSADLDGIPAGVVG